MRSLRQYVFLMAVGCAALAARATIVTNTIVETSADEGCYHYRSTLEQFKGLDIVVDKMTSGWRVGAHHDGGKGYVAGDTGFPAVCYLCFRDQRKFVEFTGTRNFYARFNWVEAYTDDEMAYYNGWLHFRVTIDGKLRLVESQMETVPGYRVPIPKEAVGSGDGTQSGDSSGGGSQEENPSGGGSGSPLLPDPQNRSSYYHDEYEHEWSDDEGFGWVDAVLVHGEVHEAYKGSAESGYKRLDEEAHYMRVETYPEWDRDGWPVLVCISNGTERTDYWDMTLRKGRISTWNVLTEECGLVIEEVEGRLQTEWDDRGELVYESCTVSKLAGEEKSSVFTNMTRTVTRDDSDRIVGVVTVTERGREENSGGQSEKEICTEEFVYWKDQLMKVIRDTTVADPQGLDRWQSVCIWYDEDGRVKSLASEEGVGGGGKSMMEAGRKPVVIAAGSEEEALGSFSYICRCGYEDGEPMPAGLTPEIFARYFRVKAVPLGGGKWSVSYDVDSESVKLEESVKAVADQVASIAAGAVESVTVPAKPGLWYGLLYKDSLDAQWKWDDSVQARGETVTLPVPMPDKSLFMCVAVGANPLTGAGLDLK